MTTTIIDIDLNARIGNDQTFATTEDILEGTLPTVGDTVRVVESESGVSGSGIVRSVEHSKYTETDIITIQVDWSELGAVLAAA